jgi:hypothetical protein
MTHREGVWRSGDKGSVILDLHTRSRWGASRLGTFTPVRIKYETGWVSDPFRLLRRTEKSLSSAGVRSAISRSPIPWSSHYCDWATSSLPDMHLPFFRTAILPRPSCTIPYHSYFFSALCRMVFVPRVFVRGLVRWAHTSFIIIIIIIIIVIIITTIIIIISILGPLCKVFIHIFPR